MIQGMGPFLAVDFAALFLYDFPETVVIGGVTYACLGDNTQNSEKDEYGGPMMVDLQQLHLKASELPSCDPGVIATYQGHDFIVVSSVLAADNNELILNIRAA